jgi:4-diphosphocytidyl-2-C-methyl-D-erythritol kinase
MTTGPAPALMRVRALAKINLTLRVLAARPDGYHEVRTVIQSIALHDTLTIHPIRGSLRLSCDDPSVPSNRANIVWQAAERLWDVSGRRGAPRDLVIRLAKRIPIQAGLGGGSSDAAAALRALALLWGVDRARVIDVAATLGADVPYFFEGGTVLGVERGDVLFPLVDIPARWVTLVVPPFGVSTKDAYSWFERTSKARRRIRSEPSRRRGSASAARPPIPKVSRKSRASRRSWSPAWLSASEMRNDLQAPVAFRHPQIAKAVTALARLGAFQPAMSGSGSAVFGLFDRESDAENAARTLASAGHGRTLVTRTVNRVTYQRLSGLRDHRLGRYQLSAFGA